MISNILAFFVGNIEITLSKYLWQVVHDINAGTRGVEHGKSQLFTCLNTLQSPDNLKGLLLNSISRANYI
jgi:hypothetical protein